MLSGVLLPGMLLTPAVPAVACEIHSALSVLPYTTRYRLYSELRVRDLQHFYNMHLSCVV